MGGLAGGREGQPSAQEAPRAPALRRERTLPLSGAAWDQLLDLGGAAVACVYPQLGR